MGAFVAWAWSPQFLAWGVAVLVGLASFAAVEMCLDWRAVRRARRRRKREGGK